MTKLIENALPLNLREATDVAVRYTTGHLILDYRDADAGPRKLTFRDVVSFSFRPHDDPTLREEGAFMLHESRELADLVRDRPAPTDTLRHYVLHLGGAVLSVISHRHVVVAPTDSPELVTLD